MILSTYFSDAEFWCWWNFTSCLPENFKKISSVRYCVLICLYCWYIKGKSKCKSFDVWSRREFNLIESFWHIDGGKVEKVYIFFHRVWPIIVCQPFDEKHSDVENFFFQEFKFTKFNLYEQKITQRNWNLNKARIFRRMLSLNGDEIELNNMKSRKRMSEEFFGSKIHFHNFTHHAKKE